MRQFITLPNGRACGIGTYAKAWRTLLAEMQRGNKREAFAGFAHTSETAASIISAMRGGLSERINRHDRRYGIGRKWDADYQAALWRDSRRLRDIAQRIRVYQFETDEARSRFSHLLASRDD
jgi:hypothetical protein